MLEEIQRKKFKEKEYDTAAQMTAYEKKISFLNRYFVYKKIREVSTEKIELEMSEYNEEEGILRDVEEREKEVVISEEEPKNKKPIIRKLSKNLQLVPAKEATDELPAPVVKEKKVKEKKEKEEKEKPKKAKKLLIIEEDE